MYPDVHSSTIYNSQGMEATQMSFNRWMDKEDVESTHNGILLGHTDGSRDYHSIWTQKEKDKYHMISLLCGIKNMMQMNLFKKQKHFQT